MFLNIGDYHNQMVYPMENPMENPIKPQFSYGVSYGFPYIWVNYNISPTWTKAIWEWFPLLTRIPVREDSEVVIIYPDIYIYISH